VWAAVATVTYRPDPPPPGIPYIADWRQIMGAGVTYPDTVLFPGEPPASELYDSGARGYWQIMTPQPLPARDPDDLIVVMGAIGVPGYQMGIDVQVIDIGGLAEPLAARTEPIPGRQAGHRKTLDPAWYRAQFGVEGDDQAQRDAAQAMTCGPVADLLDAVTGELTPGRFLPNVVHSPSYTRLRIPSQPADAVAEFC
jgi:hypothetical protein